MINDYIFRAYDIRGKAGTDLNKEIAYYIGKAFADMNIRESNKAICVGYDGRLSSPMLLEGLLAGLYAANVEVINIGLVPTPILYFADKILSPAASIMITGSHNQKEDNGFKLLAQGKSFFAEQIQQLKTNVIKSLENKKFIIPNKCTVTHNDIYDNYINRILQDVIIKDKLKIAWDTGNGAAGRAVELLCARLPNNNLLLNKEIDGNFPNHHPDPTVPQNLQQLIAHVKANNCDLGIAFDGDGDRIGVVDSRGNIIWNDQLLCLFAADILQTSPGARIIVDIKASQVLFDIIASCKGEAMMCRTGHAFIKDKMAKTGALIGGEMSGHLFFADKYYGFDDAIYTAIRLIDLLSRSTLTIDQLYDALPKLYNTPEIRITVEEAKKFQIVEEIKLKLLNSPHVEVNDLDGIRVTTSHGWWLLRASNTQAALMIRAEAGSREDLELTIDLLNEELNPYGLSI